MSAEIFKSLRLLEKERGIPMDYMLEKIVTMEMKTLP